MASQVVAVELESALPLSPTSRPICVCHLSVLSSPAVEVFRSLSLALLQSSLPSTISISISVVFQALSPSEAHRNVVQVDPQAQLVPGGHSQVLVITSIHTTPIHPQVAHPPATSPRQVPLHGCIATSKGPVPYYSRSLGGFDLHERREHLLVVESVTSSAARRDALLRSIFY